jgi:hypothetical protein
LSILPRAWRNADHVNPLVRLVVTANGSSEKPQAADDHGQQVVEVVGYPACHLAHRFEPLCLPQRLLNLPPLGHVEKREDIATVRPRFSWCSTSTERFVACVSSPTKASVPRPRLKITTLLPRIRIAQRITIDFESRGLVRHKDGKTPVAASGIGDEPGPRPSTQQNASRNWMSGS